MEQIIKVVTPALSLDLTTLANVKAELAIVSTDEDALLSRYVQAASVAIQQFCNRTFPAQTYQQAFRAQAGSLAGPWVPALSVLKLQAFPLLAIQSISENGSLLSDDLHYRATFETGELIRLQGGQTWNWSSFPVLVNYQAGFATVPADIEDAAIRMVKARYLARDRDPFLRQESIPGVRDVTYWVPTGADSGNMSPDVTDILNNYREDMVL